MMEAVVTKIALVKEGEPIFTNGFEIERIDDAGGEYVQLSNIERVDIDGGVVQIDQEDWKSLLPALEKMFGSLRS